MKRSEMLSKIASVIINYNEAHCIVNRDKAMEMAETILQVQEEASMLPPPTETDVVTKYLVYCYYPKVSGDDTYQIDVVNSQLWEPEDD